MMLNSGLQIYLIFNEEDKVSTGISWRNLTVQHISAFSAAKLAKLSEYTAASGKEMLGWSSIFGG